MDILKIVWEKDALVKSGGALVGRLKHTIEAGMEDKTAINEEQLKLLQIVYDLMPRVTIPMDDGIAKVADQVRQLYDMAQDFARAGGIIEYKPGDAYDPNNALEQGDHVLALLDPPYFLTTGYGEKMVGIDTYEKTLDLIDRVVGAGNNVIYTDSAWWLTPKYKKEPRNFQGRERHRSSRV